MGNIQVLVKESEHVHIEINRTHVATLWVPLSRSDKRRAKLRDLDLLLASTGITDLAGRDELWRDW